jgi:hypothetical protein
MSCVSFLSSCDTVENCTFQKNGGEFPKKPFDRNIAEAIQHKLLYEQQLFYTICQRSATYFNPDFPSQSVQKFGSIGLVDAV